jgi:hypothetical protein
MNSALYAEDEQPSFFDLEFKQQSLYSIDASSPPQENEKVYSRNQRYLRDALKSYSQETLGLVGLPDQTANLLAATIGIVANGAKLNLNESKTLAIEFNDVTTQDPALYFGYHLDW